MNRNELVLGRSRMSHFIAMNSALLSHSPFQSGSFGSGAPPPPPHLPPFLVDDTEILHSFQEAPCRELSRAQISIESNRPIVELS